MKDSDKWYAAVLLLEAEHPDEPSHDELFEKRVVLLSGQNDAEVDRKASELCLGEPVSYRNEYGARVIWRCRRVLSLTPLLDAELRDGLEVYSEFLDADPDTAVTEERRKLD